MGRSSPGTLLVNVTPCDHDVVGPSILTSTLAKDLIRVKTSILDDLDAVPEGALAAAGS
jgi:hypothetical protein